MDDEDDEYIDFDIYDDDDYLNDELKKYDRMLKIRKIFNL